MSQGLSFAGFARLTQREKMLRALAGNGAATFGLEVGSPRGQLGIIPMRGLGLLSQELTKVNTSLTPPVTTQVTYTATAPVSPTMAVLTPMIREAATVVSVAPPPDPTVTSTLPPTSSLRTVLAPAPESSTPSGREELDYSTLGPGEEVEGEENQFTEYEEDIGSGQQEYASYQGDGGGGDSSAGITTTEIAGRTRIKTPISKAQAAVEAAKRNASTYAPWILGGLGVAAAFYFLGKKR